LNLQIGRSNQSITNINGDIAEHNTQRDAQKIQIAALQKALDDINNSPGTLSPEDQASLDAARAAVTAVADSLEAVDNLTPLPAIVPPVNPI